MWCQVQRRQDKDDNPFSHFFKMGEDTFNSLCVPVKKEYTLMFYLCNISLSEHISRIVEQQPQIKSKLFGSNQQL